MMGVKHRDWLTNSITISRVILHNLLMADGEQIALDNVLNDGDATWGRVHSRAGRVYSLQ